MERLGQFLRDVVIEAGQNHFKKLFEGTEVIKTSRT